MPKKMDLYDLISCYLNIEEPDRILDENRMLPFKCDMVGHAITHKDLKVVGFDIPKPTKISTVYSMDDRFFNIKFEFDPPRRCEYPSGEIAALRCHGEEI